MRTVKCDSARSQIHRLRHDTNGKDLESSAFVLVVLEHLYGGGRNLSFAVVRVDRDRRGLFSVRDEEGRGICRELRHNPINPILSAC